MPAKAKTTLKPRGKAFPKGNNLNPYGAPPKEMRLSSWVQRALEAKTTKEGYEAEVSNMQAMAEDMVNQYWEAKTVAEKKAVFDTVADRTEGKARQQLPVDKEGNEVKAVLVQFVGGDELSTE